MNYITQLNGFFAYCERELSLTPNCVSLYVALLHVCNKNNWVKEFTIKNRHFEELIGIHRVKLDEARNKLKQAGLIKYKKDTGNRAGIYTITEFGKNGELLKEAESVTQNGTQTGTQQGTQTVTVDGTQVGTQNASLPFNIYKLKPKQEYICADAPIKTSFGEFGNVKMTQEEYGKLIDRFSEQMLAGKIDSLDTGIQNKDAKYLKYKDHYATILNWCKKDSQNGGSQNGSNGGNTGKSNIEPADGKANGVEKETKYGDDYC